jgi:phosphohistidine swiveling domain-containing protein
MLGELAAAGLPVPPAFVVSTEAYREFVTRAGLEPDVAALAGASGDDLAHRSAALRHRLLETDLAPSMAEEIMAAHGRLVASRGDRVLLAVRSSATAEDLAGASFAGQHGTYYYVGAARLLHAIRRCWASLWSPEAAAYRATHGIPHASVLMAVVVQDMIESEVSGVAFTANPLTGATGEIVIEASWGMGAALVDGRVTPDRYIVARAGFQVRERRIAEKRVMVRARVSRERDARLDRVSLSLQRRATLDDPEIHAVAELAARCERHLEKPQDVEWAIAGGQVYLLQSRPITTLARAVPEPPVKGKWVLFKALAENFTDPLTPLTMDLVMQIRPPGLRFIEGRLYLNLDVARAIVPLDLSDEALANLLYLSDTLAGKPLRVSWRRVPVALVALLVNHLVLGVLMARSRDMPNDFMDRYRTLCRRVADDRFMDPPGAMRRLFLLPRLLDPLGHMVILVNICSMRFLPWMAALKWMVRRWVPGARSDAVALLSSGSEGVLSAEMGREVARLARRARRSAVVEDILLGVALEEAATRLSAEPGAREFLEELAAFLAVHGHRAVKEFELAAPRWEENPAAVLGMIRNHLLAEQDPVDHEAYARAARERLESDIWTAIETLPLERALGLRRRLIRLAAGRARYYLRLRENSRFYHIMGFGVVRKKVLAVEDALLRAGKLKCRDDIFFLAWHEVAGLMAGRLQWPDVEDRIRTRRLEHARRSKLRPPKAIGIALERPRAENGHVLRGHGASPGRYHGQARVVLDPSADALLHPGEILVAPYTDPAWTPLFLTAGAAVVEVGSYLSHAGTVAREYGMPCVVDVADCTQRIATGTRLEVDGDQGLVRILDGAGAVGS